MSAARRPAGTRRATGPGIVAGRHADFAPARG